MNAITAPPTTDDADTLLVIHRRLNAALKCNADLGATGPLRAFALVDAPHLLSIANRGVQARVQLDALAGLSIRADAVRALHRAFELDAGLIVCTECSYEVTFILWPCPTMQALDGLDAP